VVIKNDDGWPIVIKANTLNGVAIFDRTLWGAEQPENEAE